MFRIIEVSDAASRVSVSQNQLRVLGNDDAGPERHIHSSPVEDLLALILDGRRTELSSSTLRSLMVGGAAVLVSDAKHLPIGVMVPLAGYSESARRVREQASQSKPSRKRAWQALIRAKVQGQAHNLAPGSDARRQLEAISRSVRSGDPDNREAVAARIYWPAVWADDAFRRSDEMDARNGFLNYGYAVARSALARWICAVGLHPVFGVSHSSRENYFALADDLLEPIRPIVDRLAVEAFHSHGPELEREARMGLASALHTRVRILDEAMPLWLAIQRFVRSYVRWVDGREQPLEIPVWDSDE